MAICQGEETMKSSWTMAVVLGILLAGAVAGCADSSHNSRDGADTPGASFLFVTAPYRIEVIVNGKSFAVIEENPNAGAGQRLILHEAGKTHFTFRLMKDSQILYEPRFDFDLKPGDMLSCTFAPEQGPAARNMRFGPNGDFFSPSLSSNMPRLECWCGRQNARTDYFRVGGSPDIEALAAKANYHILKYRHERGQDDKPIVSLRLAPPKGKTIVQGMLEAENWPGVKYVETEASVVY